MHELEGLDKELAREVDVHCSCVKVDKGSKTKHVVGGADFFGLETVDVATGLDDGQLHGARGPNALLVVPHVALVGCSGIEQMDFDKMYHEAGDGCKFPAPFLGLHKSRHQRRAKSLVDVVHIFTSR